MDAAGVLLFRRLGTLFAIHHFGKVIELFIVFGEVDLAGADIDHAYNTVAVSGRCDAFLAFTGIAALDAAVLVEHRL